MCIVLFVVRTKDDMIDLGIKDDNNDLRFHANVSADILY